MKYAFLLYDDENRMDAMTPAELERLLAQYMAYSEKLTKAGVMQGGEPLDHSRGAKRLYGPASALRVEDGPFADTKEQLGGFYIVDVPDLDAALDWAAQCPAAETGTVEIRPIWNIQ